MSEAREAILERIRAAAAGPREELAQETVAEPPAAAYRRSLGLAREELVALFAERVADYDVGVRHAEAGGLVAALAAAAREHGAHRFAIPPDLPAEWRPRELALFRDRGLTGAQLDAVDGALTGSALAIAETGTIVLDCGPAQGRRALTLVPDLHLCVVFADTIVGTVPEAFDRLSVERPVTFVSGPSATSDIELSRVRGVHGPRRLEVVIAQR
jgi:L-lactate dehydrogenase complex protein LldG